jgi:opacity protein-like surface antigen
MIKKINFTAACLFFFMFFQTVFAQGYNAPLTMQGLNNISLLSAASRSMGGVTLKLRNDASVMFSNPAALQTLSGFQTSVGIIKQNNTASQTQQWFPLSYYSNFSLLMQGLTGVIPDPDTIRNYPPNAGDSVQRPFDDIGPDWKYSKHKIPNVQIFIGAPFSIEGINFAGGIGMIEYANMNYFYQNNNVLSPDFGSYRSGIFILPTSDRDVDARTVYWHQNIRRRVGSIYGFGSALSISASKNIALGVSAILLQGQTDDYETVLSRGILRMHRNYFGLYPFIKDSVKAGISDFSGIEYTFSGSYNKQNFTFGFTLKPPITITRKYTGTTQIDSTGNYSHSNEENKTDKMKLPWRGTIGIGMNLRENISVGVQYEYSPYSLSAYTHDSLSSKPWLDASSFRVGFEYQPISLISLRAGYYTKAEIFEPEGNFNTGDPVSSSGYTLGAGLNIGNIRFNLAYEYLKIQYEDKWSTNVNVNTDVRQNFAADILFTIPW